METGSFDHEFIADTISEANTSTSNSDQTDDVNEQIYQVDIGKDFFKQLDTHFGIKLFFKHFSIRIFQVIIPMTVDQRLPLLSFLNLF